MATKTASRRSSSTSRARQHSPLIGSLGRSVADLGRDADDSEVSPSPILARLYARMSCTNADVDVVVNRLVAALGRLGMSDTRTEKDETSASVRGPSDNSPDMPGALGELIGAAATGEALAEDLRRLLDQLERVV